MSSDGLSLVGSLEQEHGEVYNELIQVIDQLLLKTNIQTKLKNHEPSLEYDGIFNNFQHHLIHQDITDDDDDKLNINTFLEKMLNLRLNIFKQHQLTLPILNSIHNERENINEVKLNKIINDMNETSIDYLNELTKQQNLNNEINKLSKINYIKLQELKDLNDNYNKLLLSNNELKFKNSIINESSAFKGVYSQLKLRELSLIKRNLMLSNFNIMLISSLSNMNDDDDELKDILLYCGDYDEYELDYIQE
ncbi:hypothetical protein CANARDRAFT_22896 [[Candida] arabinofermentans NRRL YB-2248]|uniref:Centromere protein H C-terminal domain-containing protein n=1 Tax=[Candida] arabinofermentans NRRL YB-2248 TaxID=983967 RepID=A0A1E4T0T4_9ASCO|nr:hypothetical protein CANARDRAFT_22896 [[Candida] arabinofermentans NRRL YB-2248]